MTVPLFESKCKTPETCQGRIVEHLDSFLRAGHANPLGCRDTPLCGFGRHNIGKRKKGVTLDAFAWAWSERTGKTRGCQFWSVGAAESLEALRQERPYLSLPKLEREAQRTCRGKDQLQHEHVFPRLEWRKFMTPRVGRSDSRSEELYALLDQYCQGCVVTLEEHLSLNGCQHDPDNPWLRYSGTNIKLVENTAWSTRHRQCIEEAGLI